jgi:hypothetical protein
MSTLTIKAKMDGWHLADLTSACIWMSLGVLFLIASVYIPA